MDSPLVSIVIPAYNSAGTLCLAVDSVLSQTYPSVELLVVDDGSTDGTAEAMKMYAGRLRFMQQENRGVSAARNYGIQAARGSMIGFLDHDDLMSPDKIEQQVQYLEGHPSENIVHCQFYRMDGQGRLWEKTGVLPEGDVLKDLVMECFPWTGGPLIRREVFEQVGLFDENSWCSDWELWLRMSLAGYRFACIQRPLGAYRIWPGSMETSVDRVEESTFEILDKVYQQENLPVPVRRMKDQVYALFSLWFANSYYDLGADEKARHHLLNALVYRPDLKEHPEEFVRSVCGYSSHLRVSDPFRFASAFFDHLPGELRFLEGYKDQTLAWVHIRMALRQIGFHRDDIGRTQLIEAASVDPNVFSDVDGFATLAADFARRLPSEDPLEFIVRLYSLLPAQARGLLAGYSHAAGLVCMAAAFDAFGARCPGNALQEAIKALRYESTLAVNRGVISMILKSLASLPVQWIRA